MALVGRLMKADPNRATAAVSAGGERRLASEQTPKQAALRVIVLQPEGRPSVDDERPWCAKPDHEA